MPAASGQDAAVAGRTHALAARLLAWFDAHGRKDLPWQAERTPYRVWVSEVMLQQTQVGTVIPYFERFVRRFPDLAALAGADPDEVLHLWSGLGYYSRARNLHRAAGIVARDHGGELPPDLDGLMRLPGIGRSTAGAILALSHGQRHPILDGNVRRVLARYHAVDGWPGQTDVAKQLWALAEKHTPHGRVADYTQAVMDLGAMVCTRARPGCDGCPLAQGCEARRLDTVADFPARRPARAQPVRHTTFIIVRDGSGRVLLEQRPPAGVWGGLWSFPECGEAEDPVGWCRQRLGLDAREVSRLDGLRHTFTHFHLDITPVLLSIDGAGERVRDNGQLRWHRDGEARIGLPAPVARLLRETGSA